MTSERGIRDDKAGRESERQGNSRSCEDDSGSAVSNRADRRGDVGRKRDTAVSRPRRVVDQIRRAADEWLSAFHGRSEKGLGRTAQQAQRRTLQTAVGREAEPGTSRAG